MTCQHDFEAYIRSLGGNYNLMKVGDVYIDVETQIEWRTWQKAWQAALTSHQPADGEWIEWGGGERPVNAHIRVEVKHRDSLCATTVSRAHDFDWNHYGYKFGPDIIAYRVVKP